MRRSIGRSLSQSEVGMLRGGSHCILFGFACLAVLPGCHNFAPYARDNASGPKQIYAHVPGENDNQAFSTTQMTEDNKPTQAKSITRPPAATQNPLTLEPVGPVDAKKKLAGKPGTAHVAEIEPAGLKKAEVALPQPLPRVVEEKADKNEYAPVVNALHCMLMNRHEDAIRHLRAYDDDTQEFLLRFLPPLTQFLRKPIAEMTPQEVDVLIAQLRGLEHSIRARSELVIAKMCYCKRIWNYGWYDPLPDNHAFLTASDNRPGELVQLYVELKNFVSEKTKEGDYVTRLAVSLDLVNAKGEKVWSHTFDKKDTTTPRRTRLNDFYSGYSFYVPAIPAGTYQLTIQIADETIPDQRRVARKSLDFRVTPVATHTTLR